MPPSIKWTMKSSRVSACQLPRRQEHRGLGAPTSVFSPKRGNRIKALVGTNHEIAPKHGVTIQRIRSRSSPETNHGKARKHRGKLFVSIRSRERIAPKLNHPRRVFWLTLLVPYAIMLSSECPANLRIQAESANSSTAPNTVRCKCHANLA